MGFMKVMLGTHVGYMWSVNIQILNMYGIYLGYIYIYKYVCIWDMYMGYMRSGVSQHQ